MSPKCWFPREGCSFQISRPLKEVSNPTLSIPVALIGTLERIRGLKIGIRAAVCTSVERVFAVHVWALHGRGLHLVNEGGKAGA